MVNRKQVKVTPIRPSYARLQGWPKFARESQGVTSKRKSAHCSGYGTLGAAFSVCQETAHRRCSDFVHVHSPATDTINHIGFSQLVRLRSILTDDGQSGCIDLTILVNCRKSFNGQQQLQQLASSSNLAAAAADVYRLFFFAAAAIITCTRTSAVDCG